MNHISRLKYFFKTASRFLALSGIFTLTILYSCEEEPTLLGKNLLPQSDDIVARYTEDVAIRAEVQRAKPQLTSVNSRLLLGSYSDPNFGQSKADVMTKFGVFDTTVAEDFAIDSMIFTMAINGFYGDSTSLLTLRVHELFEGPTDDTLQYSDTNTEGSFNPAELSSLVISPQDTLVNFKIVDEDFFQHFEELDDSVYSDFIDFYDIFEGLFITADEATGKGAFVYVDLQSETMGMKMYYHYGDTSALDSIELIIAQYTPRVNSFEHEFEGSEVEQYLEEGVTADTAVFISAMGGVNTLLSFPEIEQWLDMNPVAINKAELYLPVEDTLINGLSEQDFPENLLLQTYNEENEYAFIHDYLVDGDSKSYYGGSYNAAEGAYIFNMGVHFQSYLEGNIDHLNLILRASLSSVTANRVVLKGPEAVNEKMKLRITYTKF